MQAHMSIQYYVEPENIYRPKLSRMKMKAFLILDITSTTKKNMLKCIRANKPTQYIMYTMLTISVSFYITKLFARVIFRAGLKLAHYALRDF